MTLILPLKDHFQIYLKFNGDITKWNTIDFQI